MTAPDPAFVVQQQLNPPGPEPHDSIVMYDGHPTGLNGWSSWKAWDMRTWLNRLTWDLLRMQKPAPHPSVDPTVPIGLRDGVTLILSLAWQNNQILRRLAKTGNIDITDITG